MGITITLASGPADGQRIALPGDYPPHLYLVPIAEPLNLLLDEWTPPRIAEYEPTYKDGHFSRADDGSIRYQYRGTPEPPHRGQSRPTPTLDELAAMFSDPPRSAYPSNPEHLLACRTRFSLRRDARLNPDEWAAAREVIVADIMVALRERHMP